MNKYLEKIAGFSFPKFNGHKERDILDLAGFAMGGTGLAMGASRTLNNSQTNSSAKKKEKLEEQSLKTLQDIQKALNGHNKSASDKKKEHKFNGMALPAIMAGGLSVVPLKLVADHFGHKMLNSVHEGDNSSNAHTIRKMVRDHKLNVTFKPHKIKGSDMAKNFSRMSASRGSPSYMHTSGFGGDKNLIIGRAGYPTVFSVNAPIRSDIIMHELGHAKDFKSFGKTKLGLRAGGGALAGLAPLALFNDKTRDYAVPMAMAGAAPTLLSEATANYHGYKGIVSHNKNPSKYLRKVVLPNTLNYGAIAGASILGTYAAKKLLDHLDKKAK